MSTRASTLRQGILIAIVAYFVLVLATEIGAPAVAATVSEGLFGLIAIGLGVALAWQPHATTHLPEIAAALLAIGGIVQLGSVATGQSVLGGAATLAILSGVLVYLAVIWIERD